MEIYYAETPVGNVRITCTYEAVIEVEFIEGHITGRPTTIPKALQSVLRGRQMDDGRGLLSRGTEFQQLVWSTLLKVPFGQTVSYGRIAALLGGKEKARAVGSAVGANPVAILIPCHRILPASDKIGKYRWGVDEKKSLLDWEKVNKHESQLFKSFHRI
ncbi:MAG: MGMT family protein [Opitutae bacterium]|nr:MGMT family protein [Opitutae bacterium]